MASTYTVNLGIEKIGTGEQSGTWGTTTNTNLDLIDQAVNGAVTVTLASAGTSGSPNTLAITNGATSDGRNKFIDFADGGDLGATAYVQLDPNDAEKIVHIRNSLSGGQTLILFQGTYNASNDFEVPNGKDVVLKFDGAGASATVTDVFTDLQATAITTPDLTATTADINGGTIDGVTIGGSSAGAITGTTGQFNTSLNVDGTVTADGGTIVSTGSDAFLAKAVGGYAIQAYQDATSSGHTALDLRSDATTGTRYLIRGYNDAAGTPTEVFSVGADGTVTADGLTVDGDGLFKALAANATPLKVFSGNSATNSTTTIEIGDYTGGGVFETPRASLVASRDGASAGGVLTVTTGNTSAGTLTNRLNIASNGDISFYEDTGTTAKFFWDASAEALGLGTSSVTAKLDILGSQAINGFDVGAILREGLTNTSSSYLVLGDQQGVALRGVHTGTFGRKALAFYTSNNTDSGDFDPEERMRIDSAGRVGIGTSSPGGPLEVTVASGTFGASSGFRLISADGGAYAIYPTSAVANPVWNTNVNSGEQLSWSVGGSEKMRLDANGNVGLGTSSPARPLEVSGSGDTLVRITGGSANAKGIEFYKGSGTATQLYNVSDDLRVFTNAAERMRIDSSGQVGIGTDSPVTDLDVRNNISMGDGTSVTNLSMTRNSANYITASNAAGYLVFRTGGSTERMRIDASGNVGIGTNSPACGLDISNNGNGSVGEQVRITSTDTASKLAFVNTGGNGAITQSSGAMLFMTNTANTERMRIDSSGNLLVGRTSTITFGSNTTTGAVINEDGRIDAAADGQSALIIQRLNSDGNIANFYKDGSSVGSIGTASGKPIFGIGDAYLFFDNGNNRIYNCDSSGADVDNNTDLGYSSARWDDIYATNGTIQTSDRNEKENIRELLEAEARVAQAAKGLLRAFQWKDSVAEKGDDARIHFGIIAQDLQAAFEAEGLDAGRYAMFIHSTWTDEETGEERSRMGVRYSELLAFIIAAL